jgi:anti-sigma factor RsiW
VSCHELRELLHAYLDGELDLIRCLELERHRQECPACARACEAEQALQSALRDDSLRYRASARLRQRVRAAVADTSPVRLPVRRTPWRWLGLAASYAAVALLSWQLALFWAAPSAGERLAGEAAAAHVHSLLANHLLDVRSSNRHTVKPWFAEPPAKVDFAVDVPDLHDAGFELEGGRVDYLGGRCVAAIVYRRRDHTINLFLWPTPGEGDRAPALVTRQNYHLVHWVRAGMTYWAVSDLNAAELLDFAGQVQKQTGT